MFKGFSPTARLHLVRKLQSASCLHIFVVDRVLMNGHPDTIIGVPFPVLGVPLGIGVAQFLLGQVKTD